MPSGLRIIDGHQTIVTLPAAPNIGLWEVEITPPGLDQGGPNDATTMRNTAWRTMFPKHLATLTAMTFTAAYDPAVLSDFIAHRGVNQLVVIRFPDWSTWSFWGYLDKVIPERIVEGAQPRVTVTIQPTNFNNSQVETGPVYGTGTTTTTTTTTTTP